MPIDNISDARDEILDHFTTVWSAQPNPVPLLVYQDKRRDLPLNAPYARITVIHTPETQRTIGGGVGNRRFRRFGIVTVQVFAMGGAGLQDADRFANIALTAFEGSKTGEDRVTFRNARIVEVGEVGPWFQMNVIADFDWDSVK
jgi:hypothetical protein